MTNDDDKTDGIIRFADVNGDVMMYAAIKAGQVGEKVVPSQLMAASRCELRDFSTAATIRNVENLVPLRSDPRTSDEVPPDF